MLDSVAYARNMFMPLVDGFWSLFFALLWVAVICLVLFLAIFVVRYKLFRRRLTPDYLESLPIKFPPYNFLRWKLWDLLTRRDRSTDFREYGFTVFVGRQGGGKTVSMVHYLEEMRRKYPKVVIVTNFSYAHADHRMTDWRDLFEIRNGTDGVIFAIDEIHSEYSSASWKDFPESILSEISQQRKQRVKIVATSQVYTRIAKPIREQCFSVVCCRTWFGRLTRNKEYDAAEYSTAESPYQVKRKVKCIWSSLFVQDNALRRCFDTYEKIERLQHSEFIEREKR